MFICYQNDKPCYVLATLDAVNAIPHTTFTKVEEIKFAEMFNGIIYTSEEELFQAKTNAVKETRAGLYTAYVDPITAQINRLRDEEQTEDIKAKIFELIEERKAKVEEIKERYPYPDVEVPEIENITYI